MYPVKNTRSMHNNLAEELAGIIAGILGGLGSIHLMGITWETAWADLGNILWVGFVSMFTGAMGALGAHLFKKLFIKKKINK